MIRKWKVTPVSSKKTVQTEQPPRPDSRSKDDTTLPHRTTQVLHVRPKKPRRHTAGDSKQTIEDIHAAKVLVDSMNGQENPVQQGVCEVCPDSTLGRKQLISMLKERYGNEIDGFRVSADKETIRKERQRERELRHTNQRVVPDNREMNQYGGVHHSPAVNGNRDHFSGTGSEESDDSLTLGNKRRFVAQSKSSKHTILRRSDSEEDGSHGSKDGSCERLQIPPASTFNTSENVIRSNGVAFLQYRDDVKRANLPVPMTSIDTLEALFVNSFPDRIRMQDFEDGGKVIYIKDVDTGTYYMLEDVREVLNRCFLKIHEKLPSIQSGRPFTNSETLDTSKETTIQNRLGNTASFDESYHTKSSHQGPAVINNVGYSKTTSYNNTLHEKNNHVQDHPKSPPTSKRPACSKSKNEEDSNTSVAPANTCVDKTATEYVTMSYATNFKTRADSYKPRNESVEDQLDDLTELLKSALDDEEKECDEVIECVNTKNPGKLDPSLVENMQRETQTLARKGKGTLPKHFQPTIMVMAQQESDRRSSLRTNSESDRITLPPEPTRTNTESFAMSSVTTKVGKSVRTDENLLRDLENNCNINSDLKIVDNNKTESREEENTQSELKRQFISDNRNEIDVTDSVSCTNETEITQSEEEKLGLHSKLECGKEGHDTLTYQSNEKAGSNETSSLSDILMDQIMDMELEVKARSSSTIRRTDRSSSESACSKSSSIPYETMNSSFEDHPKCDRLATCNDTNDTASVEEHSTTRMNSTGIKLKYDTDEDTSPSNETPDDNKKEELTSMQHIYASISKVTALPTSSKVTTTFSNTTKGTTDKIQLKRSSTREEACHHGSVSAPDFCELEDSAKCVHASLQMLRRDLAALRKAHIEGARSFKADIQKKILEFRKKASRVDEALQQKLDVNNNILFADQHPVRERRHRLSTDQTSYNEKMSNTETRLKYLEGDMEKVRISVVDKKRVEDPYKLKALHEELTQLTKGLAEIKNRFHGLHDMLKVVITDEQKIITNEERFLKEEPKKLEGLISRCKVLSGTLFTLERLASVQLEQGEGKTSQNDQQQQHHQHSETKTTTSRGHEHTITTKSTKTAASYNYNQSAPFNDVFDIEDLKEKRNVRFNHK